MSDTKEHILVASLELFLKKNFKEVTMKEIVTHTGLSKGAFYHYFNSKEQVFADTINHFISEIIAEDYSSYSQNSLKEYYTDILATHERKRKTIAALDNKKEQTGATNPYHLIFDAMRMLPDFKEKQQKKHELELKIWKNVISNAKKKGEIVSELPNEQIAKLFIYTGDGVSISLIMNDTAEQLVKEIKMLWNALYKSLTKTNN